MLFIGSLDDMENSMIILLALLVGVGVGSIVNFIGRWFVWSLVSHTPLGYVMFNKS